MTNIIEKFDKITKTASRSLGFKITKDEDKNPSSIIMVSTKTVTKQSVSSFKKINPDALIIYSEDLPKPKAQLLKDFSWGISINSLTIQKAEKTLKNKPEFIMFGVENSSIEPLEEGSIGRFLFVENDITELYVKNLEDLPIDVVVTSLPDEPNITLNTLVVLSNIRNYITKYFFIESSKKLTTRELQELREIGIDGFIFNESIGTKEILELKENILKLPDKKNKNTSKNNDRISFSVDNVDIENEDDDE
ncbi:MAG: hypothetical protein FI695_03745 [SAR202 cluster bacterium]|nr:hypothetical protein [Chloroflexota bacterium]MQG51073.1 hypothetical protein [SAR202 cluster bacterium]|tara:strand:+ start:3949 stop:4698 length:750 start_codon:yes stop_codon:yes gene_type:complete